MNTFTFISTHKIKSGGISATIQYIPTNDIIELLAGKSNFSLYDNFTIRYADVSKAGEVIFKTLKQLTPVEYDQLVSEYTGNKKYVNRIDRLSSGIVSKKLYRERKALTNSPSKRKRKD